MANISITREEILKDLAERYNEERTLKENEFTIESVIKTLGKSKEATRLYLQSLIESGIIESVDKIIDGHKKKVYKYKEVL